MGERPWCYLCRVFHRSGDHLPIFDVWCLDWTDEEDSPQRIRAQDHQHAAERWADELDAENIESAMRGVRLAVVGEGSRVVVKVTGEATITWYSEIERGGDDG